MDHYKAGFKILEDEEIQKHQEEELEKSLGDYTILDLQSKLLDFTVRLVLPFYTCISLYYSYYFWTK